MSKEQVVVARKKKKKVKIFPIVNVILFLVISLIIMVPIWKVIVDSFDAKAGYGMNFLPQTFTLGGYSSILSRVALYRPFLISVVVTIAGTFIGLLLATLGAYVLIQWEMPGRNFFEGVPESLFEAAEIDGCSPMGTFFKIVLPLSKAALASIGLMYAVQFWNDYTNFKIYINKNELFNFQMKLRNMVMDNDIPDEGGIDPNTIANAAVIVAILPFAIIYPFCQKYFVQGVNVGAVKE